LDQRGFRREVEPGYLGLYVDRKGKQVWRFGRFPNGKAVRLSYDFSGGEAMWYCFLRIYESAETGVLASDLRKEYPGRAGSCRQTVYEVSRTIGSALWIHIEPGGGSKRRWRFLDGPPPDPPKDSEETSENSW
jgi:hypothetical protein